MIKTLSSNMEGLIGLGLGIIIGSLGMYLVYIYIYGRNLSKNDPYIISYGSTVNYEGRNFVVCSSVDNKYTIHSNEYNEVIHNVSRKNLTILS